MASVFAIALGGIGFAGSCPSAWAGTGGGDPGSTGAGGSLGECVDDGQCNGAETCYCVDCEPLAFCHEGQCKDDGICDLYDSCTCPDCTDDAYCKDPANCEDDNVCDSFNEGCVCVDCMTTEACTQGSSTGSTGGVTVGSSSTVSGGTGGSPGPQPTSSSSTVTSGSGAGQGGSGGSEAPTRIEAADDGGCSMRNGSVDDANVVHVGLAALGIVALAQRKRRTGATITAAFRR